MTTGFCDRDLPSQCHCILVAFFLYASFRVGWCLALKVSFQWCFNHEREVSFSNRSLPAFNRIRKWTKYFSWQEQYLTCSLRSLVRYCSCHSNIKFISSHHRVISSIYGTLAMLVLNLQAFKNRKYTAYDHSMETVRMAKSWSRKNQSEHSDLLQGFLAIN